MSEVETMVAETVRVEQLVGADVAVRMDKADMRAACVGACVLASGGGGSYQVSKQIIEQGVPDDAVVTMVPLSSLAADTWAAVSANMGSPGALFKTANPHAPTNAFTALQAWCAGQPAGSRFAGFTGFAAVVPVEVGAINTASPLAAAAQLTLPVVNADGAGRSIPTLPLTQYARNIPLYPNFVASESQPGQPFNTGQVDVPTETEAEEAIIGLVMTPPFGGIAGLAIYALQGQDLAKAPPVAGTLYDALQIGRLVNRLTGVARAQAVVRYLSVRPGGPRTARIVFGGRVVAMTQAQGGTDIGYIRVRGQAPGSGAEVDLWIYNQNENIYCQRSDQAEPLVMGPDSMCYVPDTGEVFDNSDLWNLWQADPAQIPALHVVAIDAPGVVKANAPLLAAWQDERAQFGYSGPYIQPWLQP
ncbi:MAG TPA: DUF917 family protein [Longimicrobium sp.]|nr:DUF917 family protein [Longimicrobium sp.]